MYSKEIESILRRLHGRRLTEIAAAILQETGVLMTGREVHTELKKLGLSGSRTIEGGYEVTDENGRPVRVRNDERECKWPIGDPGEEGFHFCGARCAGNYCEEHHRVAYEKPPPARPPKDPRYDTHRLRRR